MQVAKLCKEENYARCKILQSLKLCKVYEGCYNKILSAKGADADASFGPVCTTVRMPDNPHFI